MTNLSHDALRDMAKRNRQALNDELRAHLSLRIANRFLQSRHFFHCSTLGCYLSTDDEVDTSAVFERAWRAKKRIFAPVVDAGHKMRFLQICRDTPLRANRYGILEPVSGDEISASQLDVVVTPLVAFDRNCNRIGMGGGYYDRFFAALRHRGQWRRPKLIGFAFHCQKVEKISPNPWDIRLSRVFSEAN